MLSEPHDARILKVTLRAKQLLLLPTLYGAVASVLLLTGCRRGVVDAEPIAAPAQAAPGVAKP